MTSVCRNLEVATVFIFFKMDGIMNNFSKNYESYHKILIFKKKKQFKTIIQRLTKQLLTYFNFARSEFEIQAQAFNKNPKVPITKA